MRVKHVMLAACTMLLCAAQSFAADVVVDGITYSLNAVTHEATLTKGANRETVIIPDSIEYEGFKYAVTEVGVNAFWRIDVKHIVIGHEVRTLKARAFSQATSLEEIDVPDNVTEFLGSTFNKCTALKRAHIGRGVKVLSTLTFGDCSSLESVTLSEGLTTIGQNAFVRCKSLREINIPSTIGEIQYEAFSDCDSLEHVDFTSLTSLCSMKYGNLNARPQPQSGRLYVNGEEVTEVVVPEGITTINSFAFYGCRHITALSTPSTLKEIGSSAFKSCSNLRKVELAEGLTAIGDETFLGCTALLEISLPSTLEHVGTNCFGSKTISPTQLQYAGFASIESLCGIQFENERSNPLVYAKALWIAGKEITDLEIPEGIDSIQQFAFSGCGRLNSVKLPKSLKHIDTRAFKDCSGLQRVHYPNMESLFSMIYVDEKANPLYYGHNLYVDNQLITDLEVPAWVETINANCLHGSNLVSVVMGDNVTTIGDKAFADSPNLRCVNFGRGVRSFGTSCFSGCPQFNHAEFPDLNTLFQIQYDEPVVLLDCNPLFYAHHLYIEGKEVRDITIPEGIERIGNCALINCESVERITIPEGITSIESDAFSGCKNLAAISLPSTLKNINTSAFNFCESLSEISIEENNTVFDTSNDSHAIIYTQFNALHVGSCKTVIPETITQIGPRSFYGRSKLTAIRIPFSVVKLGEQAFSHCTALRDVYYDATVVPAIQASVFDNVPLSEATLHVPADMVEAFKQASVWSDFGQIVPLEAIDMAAYRPFIEEGKVWRVQDYEWTTGFPNRVPYPDCEEYLYFDGDTLVGGQLCKKWMIRRDDHGRGNVGADMANPFYAAAVYEEATRVFIALPGENRFLLLYDFTAQTGDTINVYWKSHYNAEDGSDVACVVGTKRMSESPTYKGICTDIRWNVTNSPLPDKPNALWMAGVGNAGIYNLDGGFWMSHLLISCTVGDEVLYYDEVLADSLYGSSDPLVRKNKLDFTHVIKSQPKSPRRNVEGTEGEALTGEYSVKSLYVNFLPLAGTYTVTLTDRQGTTVYTKQVQTDNVLALDTDLSSYDDGDYTLTVENDHETYTAAISLKEGMGVSTLPSTPRGEDVVYDLQGRKTTSPKRIYIRNGKIILRK